MIFEQCLDILGTINADNDLSEDDVIEKIKEKLKATDPTTYEKWKKNNFDIDTYFNADYDVNTDYDVDVDNVSNIKSRRTLLHFAAEGGYIKVVNSLVEKRANINAVDEDGKTPLHYVADNQSDHDDIMSAFLKKGAKIDIRDKDDNTPLHYVANCGHINGIELLIEHIIKNKQDTVNLRNIDGDTALHLAFHHAQEERNIDPFLRDELSVDFSIKGSEGTTPLLAAIKSTNLNIVKSLLAKLGEKINDVDSKYGGSILHHVMANPNISHTSPNTHSNAQQPDFECENKHDVTNSIINAVMQHIKKSKIKFNINCVDMGTQI